MRATAILMGAVLTVGGCSAAMTATPVAGRIPIRIETVMGNIDAELDSIHAPITVANFLKYVDAKAYDSATFFRTVRMDNQQNDSVRIQVIQAQKMRGKPSFPGIDIERTNVTGLRHTDGALSMARSSAPNSNASSFSVVIGAQPSMDFGGHRNLDGQGFTVFGYVTSGMDVAKKIQASAAGVNGNPQTMVTPVTILRIIRR